MTEPRDEQRGDALTVFRDPASVTVVGASADPAKWGHWLARGALKGAHRRAVHFVNARGAVIEGRQSVPSVRDVPGEPLRDVLVFDDDEVDAAHLCRVLQQFGFVPRSVAELDAAAELMNDQPFAAIFLDIELDDAGVALLQQARELPGPPGHPGPAVLMVADRTSRKLLGAQIVGAEDAALRIDVAATALVAGLTVDDVVMLDLAYAPPFSSVWSPIQVAARAAVKALAG